MTIRNDPHPDFRLNGSHYGREQLMEVGYSLVKEGETHEKDIGSFLLDWCSETTTMAVSTSGSTGKPGLHRFTKEQMTNSARATAGFFGLQSGTTALLCLPARFIGGKMMLVRAIVNGWALDYVKPGSRPLEGLSSSYDFSAMVPMQFLASIGSMQQIRRLIVGGAPLGPQGSVAAQGISTSVYESFGMTETISHIALRPAGLPGQMFTTLNGVKVAGDSRGCLVVHAPAITDNPVYTNDLVRLASETEFEWLGRIDHVVNSGGIKLIPEQIEEKIQHLIKDRFFLSGLPDKRLGEKLVLVVEGEHPPKKVLDAIRNLNTLEPFEVPKKILLTPRITATVNGKINRVATLRDMGFTNA
jgi:O-succinylbenzoic acid--CoA ligase